MPKNKAIALEAKEREEIELPAIIPGILNQIKRSAFSVLMSDIKTQLAQELADAEWNSLIPHAKRDALIVVSESLDLVEVGIAIANDDVPLVQNLINEQLIRKPSLSELSAWNDNPQKKFSTLIVQPFVLVSAV